MLKHHETFLRKRGPIRLALDPLEKFLSHVGAPHTVIPAVLVAGTNGKGSVAATLSALLTATGLKTGLFTSPHLLGFNERFRLNEQDIDDGLLTEYLSRLETVEKQSGCALSFFETSTSIAFLYFKEAGVDVAILEVGLGGRLDATNLAKNKKLVVLTQIDFDHEQLLGSTLAAIAAEKAAIIPVGGWVVSAPQHPEAEAVIRAVAKTREARVRFCGQDFALTRSPEWVPGLKGTFQKENLALALEAYDMLMKELPAKNLALTPEQLQNAIAQVRWPGRMQVVQHQPWVLVDGAHNPLGVRALFSSLETMEKPQMTVGIMAVKKDKQAETMLSAIPRNIAKLVFPVFSGSVFEGNGQFYQPEELKSLALAQGFSEDQLEIQPSWQEALGALEKHHGAVIFGSLYFVGDVLLNLKPC